MKIGNTTVITDTTKLGAAIESIAKRGKKLDEDIHRAAVSCLVHMREHGDTTATTNLILAMPRSARRVALCDWLTDFAPLQLDDKGKAVDPKTGAFKLRKGRTPDEFKADDAEAKPFWEHTPDRSTKPLDRAAFLKMVATKTATLVKNGEITEEQATEIASGIEFVLAAQPKATTTELAVAA